MTDDLVKRLRNKVEASRIYDDDEELLDEAADRIEKLEVELVRTFKHMMDDTNLFDEASDRIEKLEAVLKDDARWLATYHQWCEMNGCAPSSSDLIAARKELEGKDDPAS
jgi:DNA-binding ferritin-like protein